MFTNERLIIIAEEEQLKLELLEDENLEFQQEIEKTLLAYTVYNNSKQHIFLNLGNRDWAEDLMLMAMKFYETD